MRNVVTCFLERIRKDNWTAVRVVVLIGLALVFYFGVFGMRVGESWAASRIQEIVKELPSGSSRASVESVLSSQQIWFKVVKAPDGQEDGFRQIDLECEWNQADPESVGITRNDLSGMVWATVDPPKDTDIPGIHQHLFLPGPQWATGHLPGRAHTGILLTRLTSRRKLGGRLTARLTR
jgi:hypothetical protein